MRAKGGTYAVRRGTPLPDAYFATPRKEAGDLSFGLSLDALRVVLSGLPADLERDLRNRFRPYADDGTGPEEAALRLRVATDDRDYYIAPPAEAEFNPVWIAAEATAVRYLGYRIAARFDTKTGEGETLLSRGDYEPAERAIENLLRCAVAWCAAERGGALVHGASAVRNGRAYLFFGESGAGKSTLSASTSRATVVSDDLSLVLPRPGGGLDLVGSPFRGTYEGGDPVVGRYPLAAAFRIVKAPAAAVSAAPRAVVFGQLVGNLTFVAEAFGERPDLFASVEAAFERVPLAWLDFTKDDTYWDAIEAAGL